LAYSGGFNPRPKIQLARALPLGHVGEEEILDAWFEQSVPLGDLAEKLEPVMPAGLDVSEVREVDERAPAMQTQVVGTTYRVAVEWQGNREAIEACVDEVLAKEQVIHERRGKRYNLRPLVEALHLVEADADAGCATLWMKLSARPGATGRPEAVLDVLGLGDAFARYYREGLVLAKGTAG
jgi:radical SAM-linked protein